MINKLIKVIVFGSLIYLLIRDTIQLENYVNNMMSLRDAVETQTRINNTQSKAIAYLKNKIEKIQER